MTASDILLDHARRYANLRVDGHGVASTAVPGLVILRETSATLLQYAISKPMVALVLQGQKRVSVGERSFEFGAGESMVISADVPTISQITRASLSAPYYSLVLELAPAVIADLVRELGALPPAVREPIQVVPTERELADTALRLLRLLEQPRNLAVLGPALVREMHFWLLTGRHGNAVRALGATESHAQRIARAVLVLREQYAQPVRMEALASAAGMSLSAFHAHFRKTTSLTPLQFQKQLRLIEARRRMLAEGVSVSQAASAVGYESVPQFTREYARLFGRPPARSIREAREQTVQGYASVPRNQIKQN